MTAATALASSQLSSSDGGFKPLRPAGSSSSGDHAAVSGAARPGGSPHDSDAAIALDYIRGTRKPRVREVEGRRFERHPIKSPLVMDDTDLTALATELLEGKIEAGDQLVISESVVAIAQGRAPRAADIKVGFWATILWRFVRKVPYGIGLRSPETMQCAINEAGLGRILLASIAGGVGKLIGRRGDFYRIAGMQAATIDAATTSEITEIKDRIVLGPARPDETATELAAALGLPVAIVDVNDIGGSWVLGASEGIDRPLIEEILRDNPLGQGAEMTPFGIIREVAE